MNADSFGDLGDILRALGLADGAGEFNTDWLSRPGDYLKSVLADDAQRAALLRLIDEKWDGEKEVDLDGREWLPMLSAEDGLVVFYFVVDQQPLDHVRFGLGG